MDFFNYYNKYLNNQRKTITLKLRTIMFKYNLLNPKIIIISWLMFQGNYKIEIRSLNRLMMFTLKE